MMISLLAIFLSFLYGVLSFLTAIQFRKTRIPASSAGLMILSGLLLPISAVFILLEIPFMQIIFVAALIGLHIAAIYNGMHLYGKLNVPHHLIRLAVSALLLILLFH